MFVTVKRSRHEFSYGSLRPVLFWIEVKIQKGKATSAQQCELENTPSRDTPKPYSVRLREINPGENFIIRAPPLPLFGQKAFLGGRGGGYILNPRGRDFMRPPSSIHPPPLEGYFQGFQ